LLEIELDRYVSPREIFEAKNLERVMRYINKNTDKNVLNESVILLLHQMLISNIDDTIAGRFRNAKCRVEIRVTIFWVSVV
jgi:Fic family protein